MTRPCVPRVLLALLAALAVGLTATGGIAAPGDTTRVSVSSLGIQANGLSDRPSLSADGRYVAFEGASATNLVPNDTNGVADVFVRDRQLSTTERVSVDSAGAQSNSGSAFAALSADGRFVAFQSIATNLVPADTNGQIDAFVRDRQAGTTVRVSVTGAGSQVGIGGGAPAISGDGRYIAFMSPDAAFAPGDSNGTWDIFVHDRQTGATTRISNDSVGNAGNGVSTSPALSSDGRYAGFVSGASNLVPGDANGLPDIFVHDRQTGGMERVSVDSGGSEANGASAVIGGDHDAYLSADGRFVTFRSSASNLVSGDTNGAADVFVRDRQAGATSRVSLMSAGSQANGDSFYPTISGDGRFVAFGSRASNLVAGDTNGVADVFVHDRQTGATTRASIASGGAQGNDHSAQGDGGDEPAAMSADGRFVGFASFASNLVPGDTNNTADIFVHELAAGAVGGIADLPQQGAASDRSASTDSPLGAWRTVIAAALGAAMIAGAGWYAWKRRGAPAP